MLLNLREYHRPGLNSADPAGRQAVLDEVLALLARPGIHTAPLAGGDTLVGSADRRIEAVVDLQAAGLDELAFETAPAPHLQIGALVTRAELAAAEPAQAIFSLVSQAAAAWQGSVQRHRATVGGAVVTAAGNDPLVVALLAGDAVVTLYSPAGYTTYPLVEFLPQRRALLADPAVVTAIAVPQPAGQAGAGLARVGRTPADAPIVLAAAALDIANGRCRAVRLAVGGLAETPLRLPEVEQRLAGRSGSPELFAEAGEQAAGQVQPGGDFRGSAEYRQAMVSVMVQRALQAAWDQVAHGKRERNDAA